MDDPWLKQVPGSNSVSSKNRENHTLQKTDAHEVHEHIYRNPDDERRYKPPYSIPERDIHFHHPRNLQVDPDEGTENSPEPEVPNSSESYNEGDSSPE